jgi:hypothetical protein
MRRRQGFDIGAGTLCPERQERADIVDGEKHFPAAPDEQQRFETGGVKFPSAAWGTRDATEQSKPIVVSDRLDVHAGPA